MQEPGAVAHVERSALLSGRDVHGRKTRSGSSSPRTAGRTRSTSKPSGRRSPSSGSSPEPHGTVAPARAGHILNVTSSVAWGGRAMAARYTTASARPSTSYAFFRASSAHFETENVNDATTTVGDAYATPAHDTVTLMTRESSALLNTTA
jgi:hypothetical protein